MKKYMSVTLTLITVFLVVGSGFAQTSQTSDTNAPENNTPYSLWYTGYISDNPSAGDHVSIAIDEGSNNTPWIAYYNDTYGSLMVAHYVGAGNGNCQPNNAWKCEQVDQAHGESKGLYTSIDIHPDNPNIILNTRKIGVSYYDATEKSLKFAEYSCDFLFDCTWDIDTVDSSTDLTDLVGRYTSIKYTTGGTPNIAYNLRNNMDSFFSEAVKYAVYTGSGGGNCGDGNNWTCETVHSGGLSVINGRYISLDLDYENIAFISFYNGETDSLRYAYYQGFGGDCSNTAWNCVTIDDRADDVGRFSSLHARDNSEDYMRVAYYNYTSGDLMYAYDITGTGNCGDSNGWYCMAMDEIGVGFNQVGISLAVDNNGRTMIAYTEANEEQEPAGLKLASYASMEAYANCGPAPLFNSYYCRSIDSGDGNHETALYAGLALKPNGQAFIAYSEYDTYYEQNNLMVAFQGFKVHLPLIRK